MPGNFTKVCAAAWEVAVFSAQEIIRLLKACNNVKSIEEPYSPLIMKPLMAIHLF